MRYQTVTSRIKLRMLSKTGQHLSQYETKQLAICRRFCSILFICNGWAPPPPPFKNHMPFSTVIFFDLARVVQLTYYQLTN